MPSENIDNDLYLVTHPHPTWYSTVTRLITQGLRWVQIRDKIASDVSIFKQAQSIVQFCQRQEFDCNVLINDRVEVARALGVGVHLGQGDMSPQQARSILGPHATIGWTIHDDVELAKSAVGSIDYVGVGPIFPTTTKLDTRSVLGPERLASVVENLEISVVAIGGIQSTNIRSVRQANPWKIAMSSALMKANNLAEFQP